MRLGLFGGSFDPVHYGHLLLAECCREQCRLDRVLFVPAAIPPHKREQAGATPESRLEMLKLATYGHEAFDVSGVEINRGGVSYTVDTLRHFRAAEPEAELFLLLGADMLHDLPHWREAEEVCRLAVIVAVQRAGVPELDYAGLSGVAEPQRIEEFRAQRVSMPEIGLCSREIRRRVGEGRSVRYWMPRAIEKYIESNGLYRAEEEDAAG